MAVNGLGKNVDKGSYSIATSAVLAVGSLAVAAASPIALKVLGFSLGTIAASMAIATAMAIPIALAAILALGAYAAYGFANTCNPDWRPFSP